MSESWPIKTRCPSCGSRTLFIGSGGGLTCSFLGCKQPVVDQAISDLLAKAQAEAAQGAAFRMREALESIVDGPIEGMGPWPADAWGMGEILKIAQAALTGAGECEHAKEVERLRKELAVERGRRADFLAVCKNLVAEAYCEASEDDPNRVICPVDSLPELRDALSKI